MPPQMGSGSMANKSMHSLATSSTSGSDLDTNSSSNNNLDSDSDEDGSNSSGSSIDGSDYDGGEFRPPPGAMKMMKKTQRMSLRSSPRKNAQPLPQNSSQPKKLRGRPPKLPMNLPKKPKEEILSRSSSNNNKNFVGRRPSSAAYSSPIKKASPSSATFSPRHSPRKRCSAAPSSSSNSIPPPNLPDDFSASIKIEIDPPIISRNQSRMEKSVAKLLSPKKMTQSNRKMASSSSSPHSPIRLKKSGEKVMKNGCSPSKILHLMAEAKRRRRHRIDLVRQNAILEPKKRPKMEGIRAKKAKNAMMLGKMAKRSAKMAAMLLMKKPIKLKKERLRANREQQRRQHLSSSEEEDDEDDDQIDDDDDEQLYTIANGKMSDNSSDEDEDDEEEEEESSEEEEDEEPINFKFLNRFRHRQNCHAKKENAHSPEKVDGRSKQILEDERQNQQQAKVEPKRRGRKPANLGQNSNNIGINVVGNTGRKRTNSNGNNSTDPMPSKFNDFSNPFDAELAQNGQIDDQQMDGYRRKMRDLVDLDRYLGQPDCRRGFTRRPVHRPFLLRNLFYMQKQRPLTANNNKKPWMGGDFVKQQTQKPNSIQIGGGSRGGSRASNKMPATIKFTLIRNNNCFGNKSAIVQCFHVTELNGRLSQLKRIPSAIFEKPVNDKISTCIDIDMLEECQPNNILMDTKSNRSEHFVVRVVFRFEDAEIGGRHLRKVPSRQLNGVDHQNVHQNGHHKNLRKSGSAEQSNELVMFGAVRIFSHTPESGLNAVVGETFIILHTAAELEVNDLNTKSNASQIARLLNMENKKSSIGGVPFIRIVVLNEEEDDDDDDEEETENEEEIVGLGARLERERLVEELAEMEAANISTATAMMGGGMGTTRKTMNSSQNSNGGSGHHQFELLEEPMPQRIAIKFLLQPPPSTNNSSIPPFQPLFLSSFQPNGHCGGQNHHRQQQQLGGGQPGMKRAKMLRLSDSSADEQNDPTMMDKDTPLDSLDDEELAMRAQFGMLDGFDLAALEPKREFTVRIISTSQCFFCRAPLRIRNLWTLLKHLRFVHPRFQFTFDPAISLSSNNCANATTSSTASNGGGPSSTLPGFTVTLNPRFDASFELRPSLRFSASMPNFASHQGQQHFENGSMSSFNNSANNRKRHFQSRPTWLVTKALAQKMRTNENFPIDRFTAISQQQWGEYEYLLSMGRFDFPTPARMDQFWLIQTGSRKLEDITDLHPAEKLMMQMWNGFLPKVRLTMLGHKLTYAAARIFVHYHWSQIDKLKLRTHFLLLLTTLLNANAIDEDERYDLIMRLNGPGYSAAQDPCHWVSRQLAQLEREKLLNGGGGGTSGQCIQQIQQNEPTKRQIHQQQQNNIHKERGANSNNSNPAGSPNKKHHQNANQQPTSPPTASTNNFGNLAQLRSRFPLASNKRLAQIWKFLRHYDFPDFALISSVAGNGFGSPSQMMPPPQQFTVPRSTTTHQSIGISSGSSGFFTGQSSKTASTTKSSSLASSSGASSSSSSYSNSTKSTTSMTIAKLNANRNEMK